LKNPLSEDQWSFLRPMSNTMTDSNQAQFTDTHRRKLLVTVSLLDETLCQFQRWARGGYESSLLYREENDLSREQREAILNISKDIVGVMNDIKSKFELEAEDQSIRRNIFGSAVWLRAILLDLESKRMKGGGDLSPKLAEYLDSKIYVLVEMIDEISKTVR
jgi:hypothetical protein